MKKTEHYEQSLLIKWFRLQHPLLANCLFAIPNGGHRHITTAVKLKEEGVLAGVADLFLMIPRGKHHGMFIEMKAKGGITSQAQKKFLAIAEIMGYAVTVSHGFEMAKRDIEKYLELSKD